MMQQNVVTMGPGAGFRECIDKRFAVLTNLQTAWPVEALQSELLALLLPTLQSTLSSEITVHVTVIAQTKLVSGMVIIFSVAVRNIATTAEPIQLFPGPVAAGLHAHMVSHSVIFCNMQVRCLQEALAGLLLFSVYRLHTVLVAVFPFIKLVQPMRPIFSSCSRLARLQGQPTMGRIQAAPRWVSQLGWALLLGWLWSCWPLPSLR